MPTYEFEVYLSRTVCYTVVYTTVKDTVTGFVIRLRALVNGVWHEIRRYDTAHGAPHIDVLNIRQRTQEKLWLSQFSDGDALTFAINDIKENHGSYIREFKNAKTK